jgi:TolA-binding protein
MVQAAMNVAQIQQMQRQRMSQQIEEFGRQQRILEGRRAEQQALAQRQLEARRIASAERRQAELSRRAASIAARQKDLSTTETVSPIAASQGKLELARQLLAAGRSDTAERYLEEIVASYPGTLAANEAAQLLNN